MKHPRRDALILAGQWAGLLALAGCSGGSDGVSAKTSLFSTTNNQALRGSRKIVWSDFLGLNAQFAWFEEDIARLQIARLQALGLQWVRLGWHWMIMEPEPGQYALAPYDRTANMLKEAGLRSIVSLVGTPKFASTVDEQGPWAKYFDKFPPKQAQAYANRLQALAERYPQVDVWQIWNEPNIPAFWAPQADPDAYYALLTETVKTMRTALPNKPLAMAGMAYFSEMSGRSGLMLDSMAKLGAFNLDLIAAYHPYTAEPEGGEQGENDFLAKARSANTRLRSLDVKQIWATEWGWSSYEGPKEEQPIIGESGQADYTLRRLALMSTLDYDRIFLFTLSDLDSRASVRDQRYGLLRQNGEPKPVYFALQRFLSICGPSVSPLSPLDVLTNTTDGLTHIHWQRDDGKKVWMAWAKEPMNVVLPAVANGTLYAPLTGTSTPVQGGADGLSIGVKTSLQILVHG